MIRYRRLGWCGQLFAYRGGILKMCWKASLFYLVYLVVVYSFCEQAEHDIMLVDRRNIFHHIGKTVVFLLVFRLNQCWVRYCEGMDLTAEYYLGLNNILSFCLSSVRGADCGSLRTMDPGTADQHGKLSESELLLYEGLAMATKVHVVRLVLAMGVAFKYHCRVTESDIANDEPLDPDQVTYVLFDYVRMKGLLYPQEQALLSAACGLYHQRVLQRPWCFGEVREEYQWYTNLLHVPQEAEARQDLPRFHSEQPQSGATQPAAFEPVFRDEVRGCEQEPDYMGVPLPLVLLQLLRGYVHQPLMGKKKSNEAFWGYAERTVNLTEIHISKVAHSFEALDRLVTMPFPLAYLQHCKMLFLVWCLFYPFTLQTSEGTWVNICTPFIIFTSLWGIECLAEHFENPLGDDVSDLNVVEMIHDLEIRCHEMFNLAGKHCAELREVSTIPLEGLGLCEAALLRYAGLTERTRKCIKPAEEGQDFFHHFCWVPMPPHVFMHCLTMDNGFSSFRLRLIRQAAVGRVADSRQVQPSLKRSQSSQSALMEAFQDEVERLNMGHSRDTVTHFLCLREFRDYLVDGPIHALAEDYLNLHSDPKALVRFARQSSFDRVELISTLSPSSSRAETESSATNPLHGMASAAANELRASIPSASSPRLRSERRLQTLAAAATGRGSRLDQS